MKVYFSPKGGCADAIIAEIVKAKKSILVQAYSFTDIRISDALITRKQAGVDVHVILDRSWPTESLKVKAALEAEKIPVLIDSKHPIAHNKIVIIDNQVVTTGSYNLTNQAEENAENLLVIKSKAIAAKYTANWHIHEAHSVAPGPLFKSMEEEFPRE